MRYIYFLLILFSCFSTAITAQNPYFIEWVAFDESGNEFTVNLLTKTGYDSLIVPTGNDTLVNLLLQLKANDEALNARIDSIQTNDDFPTGDIDMKGFSILNAGNVETKFFTANPNIVIPFNSVQSLSVLNPIEKEIDFLRKKDYSYSTLYNRYNRRNQNKNGFSMQEIDRQLGGDGSGTKKKMTTRILEKL